MSCESLEGDLYPLRPSEKGGRRENLDQGVCFREQRSPDGLCHDPECGYRHNRRQGTPGKMPGKSKPRNRSPASRSLSPRPKEESGAKKSSASGAVQGKGQRREDRSWMAKEVRESGEHEPNERRHCAMFLRGLCKNGMKCRQIHDRAAYRALQRPEEPAIRGSSSKASEQVSAFG